MVKQYRKKPVSVEAVQWTGDNVQEVLDFCTVDGEQKASATGITKIIIIKTLEGTMEGHVGDYIIKGVKGEFYPCKPDIFRETYEEVTVNGAETKADPTVAEGNLAMRDDHADGGSEQG